MKATVYSVAIGIKYHFILCQCDSILLDFKFPLIEKLYALFKQVEEKNSPIIETEKSVVLPEIIVAYEMAEW